jgi:hypothetical protein
MQGRYAGMLSQFGDEVVNAALGDALEATFRIDPTSPDALHDEAGG